MDALAEAVIAGDVRACARLISRIERGEPDALASVRALYRQGGRARIIGITGPPGAGKSTLVGRLIHHYRAQSLRVAVLAVDPSSPLSGGAILGDRLRLFEHSTDEGVFIRSMAARGRLGGLASAAADALTVLDAMPWDVVLVETVGVGQSETDIMRHASVVVLLQTPMGGDEVQAAKAGVMEIADVFVVNKGDHPQADHTVSTLERMLALVQELNPGQPWQPPVVKTQSLDGSGIDELARQIDACFAMLAAHPALWRSRRREQLKHRVLQLVHAQVERRLQRRDGATLAMDELLDDALARRADPYAIARHLLASMDGAGA